MSPYNCTNHKLVYRFSIVLRRRARLRPSLLASCGAPSQERLICAAHADMPQSPLSSQAVASSARHMAVDIGICDCVQYQLQPVTLASTMTRCDPRIVCRCIPKHSARRPMPPRRVNLSGHPPERMHECVGRWVLMRAHARSPAGEQLRPAQEGPTNLRSRISACGRSDLWVLLAEPAWCPIMGRGRAPPNAVRTRLAENGSRVLGLRAVLVQGLVRLWGWGSGLGLGKQRERTRAMGKKAFYQATRSLSPWPCSLLSPPPPGFHLRVYCQGFRCKAFFYCFIGLSIPI